MGQQIGKYMIDINDLHWSNILFVASGCIILMVLVMLIFLKVTPRDAGFISTNENHNTEKETNAPHPKALEPEAPPNDLLDRSAIVENLKGIGFFEAWKTPGIIKYGIIYACLKGSTYGLLFWLPNYLQTVIGFGSESANISAAYEVGQLFGAVILGYCSDRIGKRSIVIVIGLYLSSLIFISLTRLQTGASAWIFGLLLFLAGFLFGGPEAIIGNIVSSDMGEFKSLENNARALATTVGIIDGTGAVGASIVQLVIPYLKTHSFYLYFSLCIVAAVLTTPIAIKEIRGVKNKGEDDKKLIEMTAPKSEEGS